VQTLLLVFAPGATIAFNTVPHDSANTAARWLFIRKGADRRTVIYTPETKITIQNKPGSLDDVIVVRRATCVGTQKEKTQFLATRVDVRMK
jgi:hypothetical protein